MNYETCDEELKDITKKMESARFDSPYNLNQAGARLYILDQIKEMDAYNGNLNIFSLIDSRVSGAVFGFYSIGILDTFEFQELKTKQCLAHSRFLDRITSPSEQI